jgi:hypothetical protein
MLALIICIIGLIIYFAFETKAPSLSKAGFAMFWVGLLSWLLTGAKFPM